MPGLVPGIHVFCGGKKTHVDGRDEPGHDGYALELTPPFIRCRPLQHCNWRLRFGMPDMF